MSVGDPAAAALGAAMLLAGNRHGQAVVRILAHAE